MKSLSVKLGVILFVIGLIFGYAEAWDTDWKFYGNDGENAFYYDEESITSTTKHIVRVWVRIIRIDDLNKAKEEEHEVILKSIKQKISEKKEISKEEIDKLYAEYLEASKEMEKKLLNYLFIREKRMLEEIRCADKMIRIISGAEYDKVGKAFYYFSNSPTKWIRIISETMSEALYKQVCR